MNICNIFELAATIIENILILKFYINFFSFNKKTHMNYIYTIVTCIIVCVIGILSEKFGATSDYGIIIALIVISIFGHFCLYGNILKKIIFSMCEFITIAAISIFTLQFLSTIFNEAINNLVDKNGKYRIIVLIVTKLLFYILGEIVLIITKKHEFQLTKQEWGTCVTTTIIILIMLTIVFKIIRMPIVSHTIKYFAIIFSLLLIMVNFIIYGMVLKISKSNREKTRYKIMVEQIEQQKKMLNNIVESNEKIRNIKHDMKNYFTTAICLVENEDYKCAKDYLSGLVEEKIDKIDTVIATDNIVLNSILNMKLNICNKENIKCRVEVASNLDNISDVDISIILGNLMDNAIEASKKVKKDSFIHIKIFENNAYNCIEIGNIVSKSVLSSNPKMLTTKKDKNSHGIGLMSVKEIVKKYNGFYNIEERNNMFITSIILEK